MNKKSEYEKSGQRANELRKAITGKNAQKALWDQAFLEAIKAAVVVHDSDTQIVACNKMAEELLGLSKDQMLGKVASDPSWDFLGETSSAMPLEEYPVNQVLSRQEPLQDFVMGIRRPDKNEPVWVLVSAAPLTDQNGEISEVVVTFMDITERKAGEEKLRESEERFRAMFEHMGSGVAIYEAADNGEDFIFKDFNLSAERITRIPRDEALGNRLLNLFPHMDKSGLLGALQRVWKTGRDKHIPPFYYKDETREGWRENRIYKLPSGEVVALFDDVTEQKEAEKALRESENRLNIIMDSMQTGIIAVDTETHKISAVNSVAAEMVNAPKERIIGSVCHKYVCPAEKGECPIMDLGQKVDKSERILLTAQGKEVPILKTVGRIMLDGKEHLLESFIDMTEKRKLETQLMQAQKMEAIGTLAGGIAHDFNNLLMAAQGNLSLMLYDIDSTHPHYEPLKNIEKQIKSGATLTRQLLGYARKGQYQVRPISLNELVEETSDTFGRTRKETTIHRELAEELYAIEADQGQIEQVLLNLYVNATDAMPGGGDLALKTVNVTHEDMKDKMYDPKPGKYVLLTVTDTGAGMDKEMQERIFDPFFTTKEMGRGTGLGLASAYGIVKSHGGHIDVNSEKGKGTTFSIYLPATEKKVEKTVQVDEQILRGNETILVVDDEAMVLDAAVKVLEKLGYTVLEAINGREAVEIYKKNKDKIDMVVLDMVMPEMGGGKAYDRMKEMNPKVKVLLSSGYSIDSEAKEILARGCNGFIQKPFDMKRFSQAVRGTLENQ